MPGAHGHTPAIMNHTQDQQDTHAFLVNERSRIWTIICAGARMEPAMALVASLFLKPIIWTRVHLLKLTAQLGDKSYGLPQQVEVGTIPYAMPLNSGERSQRMKKKYH
ncbi:hypothetical protein RRG08_005552 [Elysia crispata]|uniref:Uncharacterized protein n=1 Tax=Elysia crispata TaxID=231223 RepID=A0AAE1E054_9GAST|nr:hypothetical protein RRG08_005552 [Elysia crispata]